MDSVFEQNNWGMDKIEEWKKAHLRTPYKYQLLINRVTRILLKN